MYIDNKDHIENLTINGNVKEYYNKKTKFWVTITYSEEDTCTPEVLEMLKKIVDENY